MKHYTQLSKEAQDEFDRFEWEEKMTINKGWRGLTLIVAFVLLGLLGRGWL